MDYTALNDDITFLTGQSINTYLPADRNRNINNWYRNTWSDIVRYENSRWENDDLNYTDFPIAVQDSVVGQRDYALPSDFYKFLRLEAKDASGNYIKLQEFSDEDVQNIGLTEFYETTGYPKYYKELYNAVEIYPAYSSVVASALQLYYIRDISEFTDTDTTKEPGIPKAFRRLLSLGASYDWFMSKGEACPQIEKEIAKLQDNLKAYFSDKNGEVRPRLTVKVRNYE